MNISKERNNVVNSTMGSSLVCRGGIACGRTWQNSFEEWEMKHHCNSVRSREMDLMWVCSCGEQAPSDFDEIAKGGALNAVSQIIGAVARCTSGAMSRDEIVEYLNECFKKIQETK